MCGGQDLQEARDLGSPIMRIPARPRAQTPSPAPPFSLQLLPPQPPRSADCEAARV
jgi:hypothetical protein